MTFKLLRKMKIIGGVDSKQVEHCLIGVVIFIAAPGVIVEERSADVILGAAVRSGIQREFVALPVGEGQLGVAEGASRGVAGRCAAEQALQNRQLVGVLDDQGLTGFAGVTRSVA